MRENEKKNILLTNLLIKQGHCDSFCKYCYHNKEEGYTENSSEYTYENELKDNIDQIIEFSSNNFNCPIIKICGGEIFLMTNLKELVGRLLDKYPYVLIQTNGKHLNDETLEWIINYKRVFLQVSMDGHLLSMNRYRFETQDILDKLLYAIKILKKNDIYIELTSVLNKLNTARYAEFLDYLYELPGGKKSNTLKATPILLMDKTGEFKASPEDIKEIEKLTVENKYSQILPPIQYMKHFYKLMQGEKLNYYCYNPIISANYIDTGEVKGCTNVLPENVLNVGNVFTDKHEDIMNRFGRTKFQQLLVNTKQWVPLCKTCYNFCSIYNLYLNGSMSIDELSSNNYMFEVEEVREILIKLKAEIEENNRKQSLKIRKR